MKTTILILATSIFVVSGALADALFDLPAFTGPYPADHTITMTLPDGMQSVSHLGATVTHADTPGIIHNHENDQDEEYYLNLYLRIEDPSTGQWAALMIGPAYGGATVTQTEVFSDHEVTWFAGRTVELNAWATHPVYGDIVTPATMNVSEFALRLFGNVVANESSTLSAIKALFE